VRIIDAYKTELEDTATNYFVIDSGNDVDDRDFQTYTWHASKNDKIREGDLFIYRKPQKLSENRFFYIYGTGKIGIISGKDKVNASLIKTFQFTYPIFQKDLEDFDWKWKTKGRSWEHFWGQYGINRINKEDFIGLVQLADNNEYEDGVSEEIIKNEIEIENEDYYVPDAEAYTKTRPWQAAWSKDLKENYGFRCAVCGLSTVELLVGSHIIPVNADKNNRKNPRNGICLCVLHDKAFDKGYMTLDLEYCVKVSNKIQDDSVLVSLLEEYKDKKIHLPSKYPPSIDFLNYHRENIYKE